MSNEKVYQVKVSLRTVSPYTFYFKTSRAACIFVADWENNPQVLSIEIFPKWAGYEQASACMRAAIAVVETIGTD